MQSIRLNSSDYRYEDYPYTYHDSFVGGEKFSGGEIIWYHDTPCWSMNYSGRVLGESFNGEFLKEALSQVSVDFPYRGPSIFTKGDYHYHCKTDGEFIWFQGYEEIYYLSEKVYECYFHGGIVE